MNARRHALLSLAVLSAGAASAARAESEGDLARQLVNPFTSLVRVPVEFGYDRRIGPGNGGSAYVLNVQPLVPMKLNAEWTVISRTQLTVVSQKEVFPGAGTQTGLGDTLQSFFISPRNLGARGTAWGVGPAVLMPTATNDMLGSKKWALGPTAGAYTDIGAWTVGMLANHIWSVAGSGDGGSMSTTYLQPVVSYTTSDAWSYTMLTEATYDWKERQWQVPLKASIGKLVKAGSQQLNIEAGVRYWAQSPESGPKGWGMSVTLTLLFPK